MQNTSWPSLFACSKCKAAIYYFHDCGTGYSWSLYRCPDCHQLHAVANEGGFIPKEAFNSGDVIEAAYEN